MPEDYSEQYCKTIEQAYDAVSIYDGVKVFQQQFGQLQPDVAKLLAVHWCVSEVCNGGFHQFFYNSTGVLAPEAADAFEAFGMDRCAAIVRRAMARLGPGYPRRRSTRMIRLLLVQALSLKSSKTLFDGEDTECYDCYDTEAGGYEKAGLRYLNSPRS